MLKRFLIIFPVVALLLVGSIAILYYSVTSANLEIIKTKEGNMVTLQLKTIASDFKHIFSDLFFLSKHHELVARLNNIDEYEQSDLARDYLNLSNLKRLYAQIRLINENGMEVIRVDYSDNKSRIIPTEALQDKSHRYYFTETMKLAEGEIYVSPFDLNVKNKEIEAPKKPMIRFATPVFSSDGKRRGIVILNYAGEKILDNLKEVATSAIGVSFLLNREGYWLIGPEPEYEWGFMYPDKRGVRFSAIYPEEWRFIKKHGTGQKMTDNGLFSFSTFCPKEKVAVSGAERCTFHIVSFVSGEILSGQSRELKYGLVQLYFALCVIFGFGIFLVIKADFKRKLAEEETRLSERRTSAIVKTVGEGVIVIGSDSIIRYANHELEETFQYGKGELLGEHIHILMPENFRDAHSTGMNRYLQSGKPTVLGKRVELLGLKKNGDTFPLELRIEETRLNETNLLFTGAIRDISERKDKDGKFQQEHSYVKLLQEVAVAANQATHVDEAFRFCLERVCEMNNWPVGHVYMVDEETRSFLYSSGVWHLKKNKKFSEFKKMTMKTRFSIGSGLPGRVLKNGKPSWIMDISRDKNFPRALSAEASGLGAGVAFPVLIGEEVRAVMEFFSADAMERDERLMESMSHISAQVGRALERHISEEKLRVSKEQAESATVEKDKYVSLIAHDMKSPFASIIVLLKLLMREEDNPALSQYMEFIKNAHGTAERTVKMIDEVLHVSRFRMGQIQLNKKFVDGNTICAIAGATISFAAKEKGVSIKNEMPENTRLYADMDLLVEVLQNLLANAVKFCKPGDTITMFAPSSELSTIAVKDTGEGVDEDLAPDLFRHDVKTTTLGTDGEKGTGLGLPLCNDIMEAHGGSLSVESTSGEGSIFFARLPTRKPVALVVDDDAIMRYLFRELLHSINVNTLEAENGKIALELIDKESPDIVVCDVKMPVMDGFEALTRIKRNPATSNVPVILVTSDNRMETSEKAVRLGADDFIPKPVNKEEFIPRVRKYVI